MSDGKESNGVWISSSIEEGLSAPGLRNFKLTQDKRQVLVMDDVDQSHSRDGRCRPSPPGAFVFSCLRSLAGLAVATALLQLIVVTFCVAPSAQRRAQAERAPGIFDPPPLEEAVHGATCPNVTVRYAFLIQETLPLWEAWDRYFAGCPRNSVEIVIHRQRVPIRRSEQVEQGLLARWRGRVLPQSETYTGPLRYSFDMVRAMFALFRAPSAISNSLQGFEACNPKWVHVSSEADLPFATCKEFHTSLESTPFANRVDVWSSSNRTTGNQTFVKHGQWMTLWLDDAAELARREDALLARWKPLFDFPDVTLPLGAPDEWVIGNELRERGRVVLSRGPTWTWWDRPCHRFARPPSPPPLAISSSALLSSVHSWLQKWLLFLKNEQTDHPCAYSNVEDIQAACERGRRHGYFFGRKFRPPFGTRSPAIDVLSALSRCRFSAPEVETWHLGDSR